MRFTIFCYLLLSGRDASIKYLIDHGSDVNAKNKSGETPLHEATASRGHQETVKILIDRGAEVNSRNNKGTSMNEANKNV